VVLFDLRGCGRSSRVPPLPESALQPDLIADDVAALIHTLGARSADVLGFSYGGGVAMRVVEQHPAAVRRLILASTTAYGDMAAAVPPERAAMCGTVDRADPGWADPDSADPDSADPDSADPDRAGSVGADPDRADPGWADPALTADGALSRAMAHADLPATIWRLDRADEWRAILDRVRFSSDWNAPYAAGTLKPARPDDPPAVLNSWAGHGTVG
jgi:pimeloyl-ACP methyl ester carboxylesterase